MILFKFLLISLIAGGPTASAQGTSLETLIEHAHKANPDLMAMKAASVTMSEKASAAAYWPDPVISGNYFLKPIETRLGAQTANAMIVQGIPWPGKNGAAQNELHQIATATNFRAEARKLDLTLQLKTVAYLAFSESKNLQINSSEHNFLKDLTQIALAKVRVGTGGQQDVIAATLEMTQLEEKNLQIKERLNALKVQANLLADFPPDQPIDWPATLPVVTPKFADSEGWKNLVNAAQAENPSVLSARALSQAADAAITGSKLSAVPDIKASFGWIFIDEDSAMTKSDKSEDAYSIGLSISVPLWFGKYSRANDSARSKKLESEWQVHGSLRKLESEIADIWQQAASASELVRMYESTILPQAEQILSSNQSAYQQGGVTFDRVIADFRKVLMLKNQYFREQARLATLVARLEARTIRPLN